MADRPTPTPDDTLHWALEVAQLGFWDQDMRTGEVSRSPEWARMLGYEPEEVEGDLTFWLDRVHPEDRPSVDREILAHESGAKDAFRVEHRVRARSGEWRWILNWGRVVDRDAEGRALRALGFHLDITERKRAEAALARTDKLATIGSLAGGIAHDFNNLLTVIGGNLELAGETEDGSERDRLLDDAAVAVRRSQELTARLLTFARGGTPSLEPLDLERVIRAARDLAMSGSPCRVRLETEAALPEVAGNPGQLLQVFQNLLLNAAEAMPDGGTITVICRRRRLERPLSDLIPAGDYLETTVRDEGPGVPAALAERIFDPFFTTRSEGKGLGLATAHSIVADHNGLLELVPGDGPGATLRVLLPEAGVLDVAPEPPVPTGETVMDGRVLVVDDDDMVRRIATACVRKLGFTPVGAADGAEAAALYEEARSGDDPFVAVIMDLTIPGGMGGKEAVARILAKDPRARVIVSSGYSDDPVMARYRDYGFRGSLAKPYELGELRKVMAAVLADD